MRENIDKTAVLIFSRSARAEARHKKVLSTSDHYTHLDLYSDLLSHTEQIVRQSGLPYFHIDEQQQRGEYFGQKLTSAFQQVFAKGFQNVIAIGNDCPQLTQERLLIAAAQHEHNKIVLGPARDGGDYLIGINRDSFDADVIAQLPWKTRRLHVSFKAKYEKVGLSVFELEYLSDVDNEADLYEYISIKPEIFIRLLTSILLDRYRTDYKPEIHSSATVVQHFSSRAPPVC